MGLPQVSSMEPHQRTLIPIVNRMQHRTRAEPKLFHNIPPIDRRILRLGLHILNLHIHFIFHRLLWVRLCYDQLRAGFIRRIALKVEAVSTLIFESPRWLWRDSRSASQTVSLSGFSFWGWVLGLGRGTVVNESLEWTLLSILRLFLQEEKVAGGDYSEGDFNLSIQSSSSRVLLFLLNP